MHFPWQPMTDGEMAAKMREAREMVGTYNKEADKKQNNMLLNEMVSNVVSSKDEIFESGGGGYVHFYQEDVEKMKSMTVDEQLEYKSFLIEQGKYIE